MKKTLCLVLALLLLLTGCSRAPEAPSNQEAPPASGDRIAVTIMFTDVLSSFEALVEETYPDIDLQVERNAAATIDAESERRLRNGHGPSIVTTTMPGGDVRNYVCDLSAQSFVDRYQSSIFQNVSMDGKTMFIPLPGQYYGYIYNATLFEQADIPVPATQMGILDALDAAVAKDVGVGEDGTIFGIISTLSNTSVWLLATQVPDFLGLSEGIVWNDKMLRGDASFTEGMANCLKFPLELVARGYLNATALNVSPLASSTYNGNAVPVEQRMEDGDMLMVYGTTRFLNELNQSDNPYEFGILPLMSDAGNPPWTVTVPDSYLSINAELSVPGREAEFDAASRVLDLLSTPEGQAAYIADCGVGDSFLNEYSSDSSDVPKGLRDCVADGFVYNVRTPGRVLTYFGAQMIGVLNGKAELADALAAVDDYHLNGSAEVDYDQTLLGTIAEDLIYKNYNVRREETALANLIADAVREFTGAQIAFVNGGSIRGSFYKGNLFGADLDVVCPYVNPINVLEVDGATIRAMLENGISALIQPNDIPGGRFLNPSGLCYAYAPPTDSEPAKLLDVTLADGSPLDDAERYTIAVTDYMCGRAGYLDGNGDGYTMLNLYCDDVPKPENIRLVEQFESDCGDALERYFAEHNLEPVSSKLDGRIKVVTAIE